jgi:hypothetical protein
MSFWPQQGISQLIIPETSQILVFRISCFNQNDTPFPANLTMWYLPVFVIARRFLPKQSPIIKPEIASSFRKRISSQ